MPIYTDIELNDRALVVQNAAEEKENTALRVGSLLVDMIFNKLNVNALDNDPTLAANSPELVATQEAVKAYIDAQILLGQTIPPGTVDMFAGPEGNIPGGWLPCNGAAISRAVYVDLFTVIGTSYGVGDGSTTFNIPDLGQSVVGGYKTGDADYGTVGAALGANTTDIARVNLPAVGIENGVGNDGDGIFVYGGIATGMPGAATNNVSDTPGTSTRQGLTAPLGSGTPLNITTKRTVMIYKIKY